MIGCHIHSMSVETRLSVCAMSALFFCLELGGSLDSAHPIATPLPIGDEMKD